MRRLGAGALGVAVFVAAPLLAGSAPTPPPGPSGTVGAGQATLYFTNPSGVKLAFSSQVAFEARDDLARIDLTSLSMVNAAGATNQISPAGGVSVVIDRKTQRYTVWSAARKSFFTGTLPKPPSPLSPATAPPAKPAPKPSGSPRADKSPFAGFKDLKAFSLGVDMSGHGTTIGHPSTGFTYRVHSEGNDGKVNDLTGTLQTADDLGGLPLLFTANVAAASGFNGTLRIELTSIDKRDPAKLDFLVPQGYTAVTNPLELVLPAGRPGA